MCGISLVCMGFWVFVGEVVNEEGGMEGCFLLVDGGGE